MGIVEAKRLRGLEVDDQLELGRLHDRYRQDWRLLEFFRRKYPPDEIRPQSQFRNSQVRRLWQRCDYNRLLVTYDGPPSHDLLVSATEEGVFGDQQRDCPLLSDGREGGVDFSVRTGAHNIYLSFDHASRFLQLSQLEIGILIIGIYQHTNRRGSSNNFVQKP